MRKKQRDGREMGHLLQRRLREIKHAFDGLKRLYESLRIKSFNFLNFREGFVCEILECQKRMNGEALKMEKLEEMVSDKE